MHIKRFEGDSIESALAMVRADLGSDALILSSRTIRKGRKTFGLLAREVVEIQAAIDRKREPQRSPIEPAVVLAARGEEMTEASSNLEESVALLRSELARLRGRESFEEEVRGELLALRRAIQSFSPRPALDGLAPEVHQLVTAGLDVKHAEKWAGEWAAEKLEDPTRTLADIVTNRIESCLAPARCDRGHGMRIFVGAPGVGKTTTLAKLATRAEEGERDVTFLSMDRDRVGAVEHLAAYAASLEAPFRTVGDTKDLASLVSRDPQRTVLVDTPGRERGAGFGLESTDIADLRRRFGDAVSIEWVIDATSRADVIADQARRFGALAPDRIIAAKVDEAGSLAGVANLLLEESCPPLTWLAQGQRVPEDIELADPQRFRSSLLGEIS